MVAAETSGHNCRMRVRNVRRWFTVTALSGAGLGVAAATWWLLGAGTRGAEVANVWALPVSVLGVVIAVSGWSFRRNAVAETSLSALAQGLARQVAEREATALQRLLGDAGDVRPADLGFEQSAVGTGWRTDAGDAEGTVRTVASFYRSLDRGRLVVVGEPGAGKTIMVLQLVLDLLRSPVGDGARPIPLRLSPSSFLAGTLGPDTPEALRDRFGEWLVDSLVATYGVEVGAARELVAEGWVLPVLDGLDEMDREEKDSDDGPAGFPRAQVLLRALNCPVGPGLRPVVVTCRRDRYRELALDQAMALQDATVVALRALTPAQIATWLVHRFPDPGRPGAVEDRWRRVAARLAEEPTGPLATGLSSPLRLYLAVTAYRARSTIPDELLSVRAVDLDEHLFARLVPSVTAHQPRGSRYYRADDVTRWLKTLAACLSKQGRYGRSATDLRPYDLWRLESWARVVRWLTVTVVAAPLVVVIVLWLLALPAGSGGVWLMSSRMVSVIALTGLSVAFAAGFAANGDGPAPRRAVLLRDRHAGAPGHAIRGGMHREVAGVVTAAAVGGVFGAVLGIVQAGVFVGLAAAPALGVALRGNAGWLRYTISVVVLAAERRMPVRTARFYDWAWQAGLLRLSGDVIQFRHREFQEWLGRQPVSEAERRRQAAEPSAPAVEVPERSVWQERRAWHLQLLRTYEAVGTAVVAVPCLLFTALEVIGAVTAASTGERSALWLVAALPVLLAGWVSFLVLAGLWRIGNDFVVIAGLSPLSLDRVNSTENEVREFLEDAGVGTARVHPALTYRRNGLASVHIPATTVDPESKPAWSLPVTSAVVALIFAAGWLVVTEPGASWAGGPDVGKPAAVAVLVISSVCAVRAASRIRADHARPVIMLFVPTAFVTVAFGRNDSGRVMLLHEAAHIRHNHMARRRVQFAIAVVSVFAAMTCVLLGAGLAADAGRAGTSVLVCLALSGCASIIGVFSATRWLRLIYELIADAEAGSEPEAWGLLAGLLTSSWGGGRTGAMTRLRSRALTEVRAPVTGSAVIAISSVVLSVAALAVGLVEILH